MRFEVRPRGLPLNNSRPTEFNEERNCTDEDSAAARGEVKICAGCTYKMCQSRLQFSSHSGDLMENETSRVFLKRRLRSLIDRELK